MFDKDSLNGFYAQKRSVLRSLFSRRWKKTEKNLPLRMKNICFYYISVKKIRINLKLHIKPK